MGIQSLQENERKRTSQISDFLQSPIEGHEKNMILGLGNRGGYCHVLVFPLIEF